MKIHGWKLKAGLIYAATQKISSYKVARELDIYEEDLQKLSRQGIVEMPRWQVEKLASILELNTKFFTED